MRGRVSTQTLVLIDGIPTNQDWNGNAVSLNGIPLQGIERIEILRGIKLRYMDRGHLEE